MLFNKVICLSIISAILLLFLYYPSDALAVSINIINYPQSISSDIFTIDTSIVGATNATNYLRVDLYKDGTTNYFGETYNGSDWYSGSDGKSYFPIQIQNSSASATLQVQLGNPSYSDYQGPGVYKLKVRRYTSSGSQSQNDVQNPVDINITYSTPSPTPTNLPTQEPTQTPTISPTKSPTSTPISTKSPTPRPTATTIVTTSPTSDSDELKLEKAESINVVETETPKGMVAGISTTKRSPLIALAFIIPGIGFLGYGSYLLYNMKHEIH